MPHRRNHGHINDFYKYIYQITEIVTSYYGLDPVVIVNIKFTGNRIYNVARHFIMMYIREFMDDDARYERIGDFFGLTHANVLMSINKLKGQVQYNKEFRDDDKKIRKRLTKEMNKINCIYKFT